MLVGRFILLCQVSYLIRPYLSILVSLLFTSLAYHPFLVLSILCYDSVFLSIPFVLSFLGRAVSFVVSLLLVLSLPVLAAAISSLT